MHPIVSNIRRLAAADDIGPGAAVLVSLSHGATHWVNATLLVLLPFIARDFGLSYTETGSLMTVFFVTTFFTTLTGGPLVDLSGRYVTLLAVSLVSGALALIVLGLADGALQVAGAVVLIGICVSLWHPPSITYLSRRYPRARGLALSVHTLGASFGDLIAPPITGILLTVLTWNETALVNALPLFAVTAIVWWSLKEIGQPSGGRGTSSAVAGYLQGVRLLISDRAVLRLCLMSGVWAVTQSGIQVFLPLYLVGHLDAGPEVVGISFAAMQAGGLFAGPVAGAWSDRVGRRPVTLAALGIAGVCLAAITFVDSLVPFVVLISIVGGALFAIRPVIHGWTMDLTAAQTSGSAISLVFAAQSALTIMVPVAGGVLADLWGIASVFYLLTITCTLAAVAAFSMANSPASLEGSRA